jgi:hypothetical protein
VAGGSRSHSTLQLYGGVGGFDGSVLKACLDLRIRDEQILLRIILLFKA